MMNTRFVDNGYFFADEYGFYEKVGEEDILKYKKVPIRDYYQNEHKK